MLFDHCAECQRCCHIDPGFPPLEVTLTKQEKQSHGQICIQTRCEHLASDGCALSDKKPFSCKLYPLSFNPQTRVFHFDIECPLMPQYAAQLHDRHSEASQHLLAASQEIGRLEKSDPAFLQSNFDVDTDYFDLQLLPMPAPRRKRTT